MECRHTLTFRQVLELMSHLYFGKPVNYTCACGQKCELSLKGEYSLACWAVTILVLIIAETLLIGAFAGVNVDLTTLVILLGGLIAYAAYAGMLYLFYKLNKFEYTAVSYRAIVDRRKLSKR